MRENLPGSRKGHSNMQKQAMKPYRFTSDALVFNLCRRMLRTLVAFALGKWKLGSKMSVHRGK